MSQADSFKNELSRGAENLGAIKRSIFSSSMVVDLDSKNKNEQKMIAICDNSGIL